MESDLTGWIVSGLVAWIASGAFFAGLWRYYLKPRAEASNIERLQAIEVKQKQMEIDFQAKLANIKTDQDVSDNSKMIVGMLDRVLNRLADKLDTIAANTAGTGAMDAGIKALALDLPKASEAMAEKILLAISADNEDVLRMLADFKESIILLGVQIGEDGKVIGRLEGVINRAFPPVQKTAPRKPETVNPEIAPPEGSATPEGSVVQLTPSEPTPAA